MSTEHLIRTVATTVAFLAILAVYLYLSVTETAPGVAGRLEGMLAVLTPAVLDTVRVGKRERTIARQSRTPSSHAELDDNERDRLRE